MSSVTLKNSKFVFLSLLIVCLGIIFPILNVTGFCYAQHRFLSESERQRAFLQQEFIDRDPHVRATDGLVHGFSDEYFKWRKVDDFASSLPYKSVEEFFSANPDCCSAIHRTVSSSQYEPLRHKYYDGLFDIPWHYWLLCYAGEKLRVQAKARYINTQGEIKFLGNPEDFSVTHWIDNCGSNVQVPFEYGRG